MSAKNAKDAKEAKIAKKWKEDNHWNGCKNA